MPASIEVIIRKPIRRYPLPSVITDLDNPYRPKVLEGRFERMSQFQEGYDTSSGENPTIVKPAISKSDLLSKM
jgi:hypothetical protein